MQAVPIDNKTPVRKKTATSQLRRIALNLSSAVGRRMESSRDLLRSSFGEKKTQFRLQRTRSGGALTTEPEILPAMVAMWKDKPIDELPVAKDLPRLVRRVVIVDEHENILYDSPSASTDEDTSLKRSIELTSSMILALVEALEGKNRSQALLPEFQKIVDSASETSEAELLVRDLIHLCGEDETQSSTIRALKTVHQDIVGHCTFQLKQHITTRFMTKDVRTPEGWRILIRATATMFQVSHTRREQSIDTGGDRTNHWEFEWELRMMFDSQVKEMKHAQLRVTDLFLSQTIDPQLEEDIKHDLLGGELI